MRTADKRAVECRFAVRAARPCPDLGHPAEEILSPRRLATEAIGAGKTTGLRAVITSPRQPDQTGSQGLCLEPEEAGRRLLDWASQVADGMESTRQATIRSGEWQGSRYPPSNDSTQSEQIRVPAEQRPEQDRTESHGTMI